MVAICKSIYVVYWINSTHKFLHSGLFKYFCMGENGWRVSYGGFRIINFLTLLNFKLIIKRNCINKMTYDEI